MPANALHLTAFEGGNALSSFRAWALVPRLQAIEPGVTGLSARHVHWVATDAAPDRATTDRLAALLDYGDRADADADGELIVVMPRCRRGRARPPTSRTTVVWR